MEVNPRVKTSRFGLDPRTKLLVLFSVGFFVFSSLPIPVEVTLWVVLSILLIASGLTRFSIRVGVVFLVLLLLDLLFSTHVPGWIGALFLAVTKMPRYVILMLMAANLLIKTTSVSEFTAAFKKMYIPEKIIIPFSVMFRFIPTIKEEWLSISRAMRLRGIGTSVFAVARAPMQTLEYGMIPMLMSVATISGELAAASLSRGLDADSERTCLTRVGFGISDVIVLALCAVFVGSRITAVVL